MDEHTTLESGWPRLGAPNGACLRDMPERLGGKASALHLLRSRRLPVPDGFVVPVEAYTQAVFDPTILHLLRRIGEALDEGDLSEPGALQRTFPEAGPPAESFRTGVDASLSALEGNPPRWLAVRSSATAEDGARDSFAGILESYLPVAPSLVPEAIILCWATLHTRRFIAYCDRRGIDPDEVGIAVIVQPVVAARAAGVMLTHDPVSGAAGPVINAARGIGPSLVDGKVDPDEYRRLPGGTWEERRGRQA